MGSSSKPRPDARTTTSIDSGGWFMGRRYLVPVGKATFEATRKALVLDVDRDTIKTYPEFSTNAFMAMSDDEVRRYERRVLHTINPNASASTTYWESYDRLPEYSQPDWLRPTARPRTRDRLEQPRLAGPRLARPGRTHERKAALAPRPTGRQPRRCARRTGASRNTSWRSRRSGGATRATTRATTRASRIRRQPCTGAHRPRRRSRAVDGELARAPRQGR